MSTMHAVYSYVADIVAIVLLFSVPLETVSLKNYRRYIKLTYTIKYVVLSMITEFNTAPFFSTSSQVLQFRYPARVWTV